MEEPNASSEKQENEATVLSVQAEGKEIEKDGEVVDQEKEASVGDAVIG